VRFILGAQLSAKADGAPSSSSRGGLFPDTTDNIHIEMVFNYELTQSQLPSETGVVDLVWGLAGPRCLPECTTPPTFQFPSTTSPTPSSGTRTTIPIGSNIVCNRKTLAYEFGDKNHAPLDIANPDVQAFSGQTGSMRLWPPVTRALTSIPWT